MLKSTPVLAVIFLFKIVAPLKHIEWGEEPCILIDIDAFNNLEWIDQHGKVTVAANFSFDDVYITEGSCDHQNPYVGGIWSDGKSFELVFYNNSGRANVEMNIYFNPTEVFRHNLTDNVRNIVYFDVGPIGKAYRCETTTSHVTKVHVGKEAYQYSFGIVSINIQGYNVSGGKFGEEVECPDDTKSSKHSSPSTTQTKPSSLSTKTTHTTHPSTYPTHSTTHSTHKSTKSTRPSSTPTTQSSTPVKPTNHSSPSTKPSNHTKPTTKPTNHTTPPTKLTNPSTPSTKPTNHSTPSTKPTSHSTPSSIHSTKSSPSPSHSSSHSTNPQTHSTLPPLPKNFSQPENQTFNTQCMRMVGKFQLNLSYPSDTPGKNLSAIFGVNDINHVSGSCGQSTINVLYITFYNNWQLNITVKRENSIVGSLGDGDTDVFWWSHIYVQCFYNTTSLDKTPWFPNVDPKSAKTPVVISSALKQEPLQAKVNGSYICNAQSKLDLGYGNSLSMWNLQYSAFQNGPDTTFSDKGITECSADSADSTTKGNTYIYVGIGLAVIVTMVMIVYIAGRCCYRKNFEEM